jgi:hypothetical protein
MVDARVKSIYLIFLLTVILSSCTSGLNPADYAQKAVLGGTIHYVKGGGAANFPPKDSLLDIRAVGFKEIPLDTNVIGIIGDGEAFFSTSLLDSAYAVEKVYTFEVPQSKLMDSAVVLKYIVIAQLYGANFTSDWRVIGVYSTTQNFQPASIKVSAGEQRNDLDINVDFSNPPPQPFKR